MRPEHISLRTIPVWKTNINLNKGILASDSSGPTRGVLPAGGGLMTYRYVSGGDAIRYACMYYVCMYVCVYACVYACMHMCMCI